MTAGIFGVGAALPEHVVTNADLEQRLDTNDEWIVRRTGIRERRHLAGRRDAAPTWPTRACLLRARRRRPHRRRGRPRHRLDDHARPRDAGPRARGRAASSAPSAPRAVDLNAACAGFLYAPRPGRRARRDRPRARRARVRRRGAVSASPTTTTARRPCSSATAPAPWSSPAASSSSACGGFVLGADGAQADLLYAERDERMLRMQGREVYRHAVRAHGRGRRARRSSAPG